MPVRKAEGVWQGDLKGGSGKIKLASGAFEGKYSFMSRFEEQPGTNPEELIAAAHAGCFSMAFSNQLAGAGHTPKQVKTTASVSLEKLPEGGFGITKILLQTEGDVPGIDEAKFQELANKAKVGCPVSKALAATNIVLEAKLVGR